MEARHEIISFDNKSPIKLFTHKLGDVTRHWHESLELLFVLAGDVTVLTGDTQFTLSQDDMLLINSNVVHELHSESCVAPLLLQRGLLLHCQRRVLRHYR